MSTIENCPYAAYLTYVKHYRGQDNIYGVLGGNVHDALENIMHDEINVSDLSNIIEDSLEQAELLGLSFPKDRNGNDTIKKNWTADMKHFAKHFVPPAGVFDTEEFFLYKVDDDTFIQGYIDLIKHDQFSSNEISIYDWKTSSMYSGNDLDEHAKQLLIYALAAEQDGKKVNHIAWYFLKYVTVTFMGKARSNSKTKTKIVKNINRRKLVQELEPYLRQDLIENDYDDIEIELFIDMALATNSLDSLPASVRENYIVKPCIVEYPLNDETRAECKQWIKDMISKFEQRDKDDANQWEPRAFTKKTKSGREVDDYFFCSALCGHSKHCKHLTDFLEQKRLMSEDLESFL